MGATVCDTTFSKTLLDGHNYHVDYARLMPTFQLSDLAIGAREDPFIAFNPQFVVNLAQSGGLAFIRRSHVQGRKLRTLWDTGAIYSYIHEEFRNFGKIKSKQHFVRSVLPNGQTHSSNELVQR